MTKSKLEFDNPHVNFTVKKTIKIGNIIINMTAPCEVYYSTNNGAYAEALDYWGIKTIEYNDIVIDDYKNIRKFRDFHKDMGIDIEEEMKKHRDDLENEQLLKVVPKAIINFLKNEN